MRSLDELEPLRSVWEAWPGTLETDLDHFTAAVKSQGAACRPHVMLATRNAIPDAILVGMQYRTRIPLKVGTRTICRCSVDVIEFVRGGSRGNVNSECSLALVRELMRQLHDGEADLVVWDGLSVESPLYEPAVRTPPFCFADLCHPPRERWLMNFPGGVEGFFASLGRSQRSRLQRKYRKVLNHFSAGVKIRGFHGPETLDEAIAEIQEVACKTEKRRLGFGFVDSREIREQMSEAAKKRWLRTYILYFHERPTAFWVGTLYDRNLQAQFVGYDPIWRDFSPGIFLFLSILEDMKGEDIQTIDFGCGNSQLRQCFGDRRQVESGIRMYAPNFRGLRLNLAWTIAYYATVLLRRSNPLTWSRTAMSVPSSATEVGLSYDAYARGVSGDLRAEEEISDVL